MRNAVIFRGDMWNVSVFNVQSRDTTQPQHDNVPTGLMACSMRPQHSFQGKIRTKLNRRKIKLHLIIVWNWYEPPHNHDLQPCFPHHSDQHSCFCSHQQWCQEICHQEGWVHLQQFKIQFLFVWCFRIKIGKCYWNKQSFIWIKKYKIYSYMMKIYKQRNR